MYKYLFALLLFVHTTCKSQDENYITSLNGAYLLLSQSLEGSSVDTTYTERKQLKIYANHYVMYVRLDPEDSLSSFGIGTFSIDKGKLTEHIIYSASDTVENKNLFSGTVNISKRLKGYEQVIPQIASDKGKVRLTEDYELLNANLPSPLDGSWKLTAAYIISLGDTVRNNAVKYKTYYKGNFSSGSFKTTLPGKHKTTVEYGTFRMNGKNKLKENVNYSTISARKGQPYDFDISLKGSDVFTLKFTNTTGAEEIEKYMRMK